jgi:RNA polymerase sigma-70 factor (ECF subfamily)
MQTPESVSEARSDNELVQEALAGQVTPFKELVERYQKTAYLYARGMVRNADDAYDLSQEAFIRVFRHLRRFNPAYPFKVWFFHILSNLCKNHIRKMKNRDAVMALDDDGCNTADSISESPEAAIYKSELQKQVWEAIGRLPEKFREIIILSHFQDMSYEQIAQVLEIPRGSVMSRLYYARLKVREILEANGVEI